MQYAVHIDGGLVTLSGLTLLHGNLRAVVARELGNPRWPDHKLGLAERDEAIYNEADAAMLFAQKLKAVEPDALVTVVLWTAEDAASIEDTIELARAAFWKVVGERHTIHDLSDDTDSAFNFATATAVHEIVVAEVPA